MKCQVNVLPQEPQDCPNEANGMFDTMKGILPLCKTHSDWAKKNKLIINRRDNYFG